MVDSVSDPDTSQSPKLTPCAVPVTKQYIFLSVDFRFHHVTRSGQWNSSPHGTTDALGDWACCLVCVSWPWKVPPPGAAATQPEPWNEDTWGPYAPPGERLKPAGPRA